MADGFVAIESRPPPRTQPGFVLWLRQNFFGGLGSAVLTLAVLLMLAVVLPPLWNWGVWHAIAGADNAACRAAHGTGACWGVVAEKGRLIIFGRYPFE